MKTSSKTFYDNNLNNTHIFYYTMFSAAMKTVFAMSTAYAFAPTNHTQCQHTNHLEWQNFMQTHHKSYSDDTIDHHFNNFINNLDFINAHNADSSHSYSLHINKYADLSPDEFNSHIKSGCYKASEDNYTPCVPYTFQDHRVVKSLDWRDFGAVTPVKNQGKCGSCWSFSATGALEGAWRIHTGQDVSLSEQQLIDCSTAYGNNGCDGGIMDDAFGYAIEYGMCTEDNDPYEAKDGDCTYCVPSTHFDSCQDVEPNNENALLDAIHNGPISVAIEADQKAFQFYQGGIIDTPSCGTNTDHGVLLVGFGTEPATATAPSKDYWIIKNSWGPDWGDNGYVRLARTATSTATSTNSPGMCGIATQPSFPSVHANQTHKIIDQTLVVTTTCHCVSESTPN